jgi:2'-5' RNA ligase
MRTFIAIELPENIKTTLSRLQDKLKQCGADVKWVEPHNIHLTLKFLGEIEDSKLEKINQIIKDTAENKLKFEITLAGLGVFPNINHPKIIWVGIKNGDNETKLIAEELEEKLQRLNIPKEERQFSGHITIGRIKSWLNKDKLIGGLSTLRDDLPKEKISFIADKITLFKSSLKPNGPIYEVLKEVTLDTT